jgi:hypothetical protein
VGSTERHDIDLVLIEKKENYPVIFIHQFVEGRISTPTCLDGPHRTRFSCP